MGWVYAWPTARSVYDEIVREYHPIAYRAVDFGHKLWAVCQDGEHRFIVEFLCRVQQGEWGYKVIDETMGPEDVNCPLSLLEKCTPPLNTMAEEWREKVRRYHARVKSGQRLVNNLQPGDRFELFGQEYIFQYKLGRRVIAQCNGLTYWIRPAHFRHIVLKEESHEKENQWVGL